MQNIDTSRLNQKQLEIWSMVQPQSGVTMLKGKAGIAKSATCKGIADNVLIHIQKKMDPHFYATSPFTSYTF